MTETRQTFAGLSHWEIVFWYGLIVLSTADFALGAARLVSRYAAGRPLEARGLGARAGRAAA
ncbi:MAG: hypothetical protein HOQ28_05595, partial [Thermoleophilia bacterium]|nr:hypothetical protein [Thermoleophilia bacterium]